MIKHSMKGFPDEPQTWQDSLEALLLNAVDEIERARLQPKIGYGPNSHMAHRAHEKRVVRQYLRPHPVQLEHGGGLGVRDPGRVREQLRGQAR